ncbi:MAG: hypothetical protein IT341_06600 [Chloroflexi bacterium]|nr:hypothetical protein [Chloroflexota bacterium]
MTEVQLGLMAVAGLALLVLVVATLRMLRPDARDDPSRSRRAVRPLEDDPIIAALGLGRSAGPESRNRR